MYLFDDTFSYNRREIICFDAIFETTKLFLLAPIVESRHEYDHNDRYENGNSLDPLETIRRCRATIKCAFRVPKLFVAHNDLVARMIERETDRNDRTNDEHD